MKAGQWRVGAVRMACLTCIAGMAMVALLLAGCAATKGQWQPIGPDGNAQINVLASDPHIPGILYAGGSDGTTYVARGDHSGLFVASDKSPGSGAVNVIYPNPYTKGAVYTGTNDGLYASNDYGEHYAPVGSGLPSGAGVTAITTAGNASALFASVAQHGLYASADGGKTWTAISQKAATTTTGPLPASATVQTLLWDSAAKTLYAGVSGIGDGVYVSQDAGASWSVGANGLPLKTDVFALLEMPSGGMSSSGATFYAATSAGVFALTSDTRKWQLASTGMTSPSVYSLAAYPATPGLIYAGTDKTVYVSADGGWHWKKVANGLTHTIPAVAVSPGQDSPTVAYAAAGQILRYPAASGGSDGGILSGLLLVVIVGLVAWYILAHYHFVPSFQDVRRRITQRATS